MPSDDAAERTLQDTIGSAEEAFRTLCGKIATSIIFLACSLIVYSFLPFYPRAIVIFLGLVLAAIAYRWPAVALSLMLLLAAPAFAYQLGGTLWALLALGTVAVALPFGLSSFPGAIVGVAAGAAAGSMMLTPYYLAAIPTIGGITLLRLRGSSTSAGWAVFTFLAFYVPFLILTDASLAPEGALPLFTRVEWASRPVLDYLDLASFRTALPDQFTGSVGTFGDFSAYFVQGWGGIALILTMLTSVAVVPAMLGPLKHVDRSGMFRRAMSPLLIMLIIELVFLVPLLLLEKPLGYRTGLSGWGNIGSFTGAMIGVAVLAFLADTWLSRRTLKVKLRQGLVTGSHDLYELLDSMRRRTYEFAAVCRGKDLGDEKAAMAQAEEKVALTLESESALSLPRLEMSCNEFDSIRSHLSRLHKQLEEKLFTNLEESKRLYKAIVDEAHALGIPSIDSIIKPIPASGDSLDFETALAQQEELNTAFKDLATELVSAGDLVSNTIQDEIDPDFSLTTIDIGHGFLGQARYEEAARTISEDLQIIDGRIENSIVELSGKVASMAVRLEKFLRDKLIPAFEVMGDVRSTELLQTKLSELEGTAASVRGSRTLAHIIIIVEESRKLEAMAGFIVSHLKQVLEKTEENNNRRSPSGYVWGRSHAAIDAQEVMDSVAPSASDVTISTRFKTLEKALEVMEQQVKAMEKYGQVSDLLINYANLDSVINEKLEHSTELASSALPVRPRYAVEFLKMYAAAHPKEAAFDAKSGLLKRKPPAKASAVGEKA